MTTLNLNGNYAEQMLSLYLWGQTTAPNPSEIADEKWIRPTDATVTAEIDASAYMEKVGNHFKLADQKMFQLFFNNEYRKGGKVELSDIVQVGVQNGNEIILNHEQFVTLFYKGLDKSKQIEDQKNYKSAEAAELNLYHYRTNTGSEDYWQRAFTFGSSKFQLDKENIKYVFDARTGQAIRLDNVKVKPLSEYKNIDSKSNIKENFDFESNQGIAKEINPILKQMMDPSNIGRKVNIEFINNGFFKVGNGSFTQENYRDAVKRALTVLEQAEVNLTGIFPNVPARESPNMLAFLRGLKLLNQSNVYDFLDENGKVVVYGTQDSDILNEFQAKNLNLDKDIDTSSFGFFKSLLADIFFDIDSMNKFRPHLKKGIIYIGGERADSIKGTKYDDHFYGGKGSDILYGGDGNDILYGNSKDDKKDDNAQNTLYGEKGNDTLYGSGRLEGGKDFDTYFAYDTAVIKDEDGKGMVHIELAGTDTVLTGGVHQLGDDENVYQSVDGHIKYQWDKKTKTLKVNDNLTIEDWENGDLGIHLNAGRDIAFVVDTTASMWDDIDAVKASAINIIDMLFDPKRGMSDSRVAVVGYNDPSTKVYTSFTNQPTLAERKQSAISAIQSLSASSPPSNTDIPEMLYSGLLAALNGSAGEWREEAQVKRIFLFGDAPAKDGYLASQVFKLAGVMGVSARSLSDKTYDENIRVSTFALDDQANQKTPVKVEIFTILIGHDHNAAADFNHIAHTTGGQAIQSDNATALANKLFDLLQTGSEQNDIIQGNDNDNVYHGAGDQDTIYGFAGDDILDGGKGYDTMIGGLGDDSYYVDHVLDKVIELADEGIDMVYSGIEDYILPNHVENLVLQDKVISGFGNHLDNTIIGNDDDNLLDGGIGNDTLKGGQGVDTYQFSLQAMNDGTIKHIIDSDGLGKLQIAGEDWSNKIWYPLDTDQNTYHDQQGSYVLIKDDNHFEIYSDHFSSRILIESSLHYQPLPLGLRIPNRSPKMNYQLTDQLFISNQMSRITLPDDLFVDADGDSLTYQLTLTDDSPLPTWLQYHEATKTLMGIAPVGTDLNLKITAADSLGANGSQIFNLKSNSMPTVQNPIGTQYIQTKKGSWTLALDNVFHDADKDNLHYQLINKDHPLSTDIYIDQATGKLYVDTNRIPTGSYDIIITATDQYGASVNATTQLNLVDNLIRSNQGLITGTLDNDTMFTNSHLPVMMNGLSGNDFIQGGHQNDILNGGLGHDTLVGQQGNDILIGGFGDDIYQFNRGDGQDKIFDIAGQDTIRFGAGITMRDVLIDHQGANLKISLLNSNDSITIEGYLSMANQRIEKVQFTVDQGVSETNLSYLMTMINSKDYHANMSMPII